MRAFLPLRAARLSPGSRRDAARVAGRASAGDLAMLYPRVDKKSKTAVAASWPFLPSFSLPRGIRGSREGCSSGRMGCDRVWCGVTSNSEMFTHCKPPSSGRRRNFDFARQGEKWLPGVPRRRLAKATVAHMRSGRVRRAVGTEARLVGAACSAAMVSGSRRPAESYPQCCKRNARGGQDSHLHCSLLPLLILLTAMRS